jgi:hypothetical protein
MDLAAIGQYAAPDGAIAGGPAGKFEASPIGREVL